VETKIIKFIILVLFAISLEHVLGTVLLVETKIIKLIILVKAGYYMLFISTFEFYWKNQNYKICNFGFVHNYMKFAFVAAFVVETKIINLIILVKAGHYKYISCQLWKSFEEPKL